MATYFAYGSNMDADQLKKRVGDFSVLGTGFAEGCVLKFNKLSRDGSGKANIVAGDGVTEGVLFSISEDQLGKMDAHEGGYHRQGVAVKLKSELIEATTYVANSDRVNDALRPTKEYLETIVRGARHFKLSSSYIQQLAASTCI